MGEDYLLVGGERSTHSHLTRLPAAARRGHSHSQESVLTLETSKTRHRLLGTDNWPVGPTWQQSVSGVSLLSHKEVGFQDLGNLPVITRLRWWRQNFEPSGCPWSLYHKHTLLLPGM